MKKMVIFLALFWSIAVLAVGPQYQIQVDGLACPFCAYGIEKKLSLIEHVEDIRVDIAKGQIIVTMEDGTTLSETLAREQVRKSGFTLRSISEIKEAE